jgi:hypothetical protein
MKFNQIIISIKLLSKKKPKEENIIEPNNGLNIISLEKPENTIQNINILFIQGVKLPWENLVQEKKRDIFTKKRKRRKCY